MALRVLRTNKFATAYAMHVLRQNRSPCWAAAGAALLALAQSCRRAASEATTAETERSSHAANIVS